MAMTNRPVQEDLSTLRLTRRRLFLEYETHHHNEFVEIVTHGDGEEEVFQEFLDELLGHPHWKPGFPILIDYSGLNAGPLTPPAEIRVRRFNPMAEIRSV